MMWFMDHLWMTFILAFIALLVVEESVSNICKAVMEIWHTKERMKAMEAKTEHELETRSS